MTEWRKIKSQPFEKIAMLSFGMRQLGGTPRMQSEYSPEYMSKVAIDVIRSNGDIELIADKFGLPVSIVRDWHDHLLESASDVFWDAQEQYAWKTAEADRS